MGVEKNLRRQMDVPYTDILAAEDNSFRVGPKHGESFSEIENYIVHDCGYTYAIYEVDRLLNFVAIGYSEIKYGKLTNRMMGELQLDIPVWDSGVVDEFFIDGEEKKLVYAHLKVIKDYIKEHSK